MTPTQKTLPLKLRLKLEYKPKIPNQSVFGILPVEHTIFIYYKKIASRTGVTLVVAC